MGSIPSCVITAFGKEFGEADGNYRQGLSSASTDNPYQDLDYSGYHKNLFQQLSYYTSHEKKMVTTVSGTDNLCLNM